MHLSLKPLGLAWLGASLLLGKRSVPSDKTPDYDLVVEEYKTCRDLIVRHIEMIEKVEVYVAGAVAGLITFSVSLKAEDAIIWTSYLPTIISALGYFRYRGLASTIKTIDEFLIAFEKIHEPLEFTRTYRSNRRVSLWFSRFLFWLVLFLSSIAYAAYIHGGGACRLAAAAQSDSNSSHARECPKPSQFLGRFISTTAAKDQ